MAISDDEIVTLVSGEFESAMGAPGGDIAIERASSWDYYQRKLLGDEVEGQSTVVTSDVSDVIDTIMPSLLRIFTVADNLVSFEPVGAEDMAAAEQESDYVNHVFFKQNPSFMILYTWFMDALIQKNGVVKAWWEEAGESSIETYQALTEAEVGALLDDPELEALEKSEQDVPMVVNGSVITQTVFDIRFRRTAKRGRVRVEPVPPEEYRISSDARDLDPSKARMVGQEREITRSELLEMGFDKAVVESLSSGADMPQSDEDLARRDRSDEQQDDRGARDRSQDRITVQEAHIRLDADEDGRAELRQITIAGGKLLLNEEVDRQPFHVISPAPLPHKHFGRATAEKVTDIQEVNTVLLRQVLDNLYHSNRPGHAVWEQGIGDDTLDDLLTTRVGRIARFARPVADSWAPMSVPFTAGQTFPMIEWFDKAKRDRTGIAAEGQGLTADALKNIQTNVVAQMVDLSRMKVEAIARIFAETGIKSLFRHIHELLLKHQNKAEIVRLRNQWVEVDPREWRTRHNMDVTIGLGIGTREQNLLHLDAIWQKQKDIVDKGGFGSLVTPENVFNTAAEMVKNANLKNPELFFTRVSEIPDPGRDEQARLAELQTQLAQEQVRIQQERLNLDRQKALMKQQIDRAKLEMERQANRDQVAIELEKIANDLTELDLEYSETEVPGSRV